MASEPVPLREALREAVVALADEAFLLGDSDSQDAREFDAALDRVAALIAQIPLVFEAREGA